MEGTLARHPYCKHCGAVALLGKERGLGVGHYVNALSMLAANLERMRPRGVRMTRAQRGMIVREILSDPMFADPFGVSRAAQMAFFVSTVRRFRKDLSPDYIRETAEHPRA